MGATCSRLQQKLSMMKAWKYQSPNGGNIVQTVDRDPHHHGKPRSINPLMGATKIVLKSPITWARKPGSINPLMGATYQADKTKGEK